MPFFFYCMGFPSFHDIINTRPSVPSAHREDTRPDCPITLAKRFIACKECTFTTRTHPTLKNKLWVGTNFIKSPSIIHPRGMVILIKPDIFNEVTSSPLQENLKTSSSDTANKNVFFIQLHRHIFVRDRTNGTFFLNCLSITPKQS